MFLLMNLICQLKSDGNRENIFALNLVTGLAVGGVLHHHETVKSRHLTADGMTGR